MAVSDYHFTTTHSTVITIAWPHLVLHPTEALSESAQTCDDHVTEFWGIVFPPR